MRESLAQGPNMMGQVTQGRVFSGKWATFHFPRVLLLSLEFSGFFIFLHQTHSITQTLVSCGFGESKTA